MKRYFYLPIVFVLILSSCGGGDSVSESEASEESAADTTQEVAEAIVESYTFDEYCELNKNMEASASVSDLDTLFAYFEKGADSFSQDEKDSAYFTYIDRMNVIAYEYGEDECPMDETDQASAYEPYGLNMQGAEGYCWLHVSTEIPGERFKSFISADLYEFALLGEISGRQFSADAGMIYSYEEWGEILIDLEERIMNNKGSKYLSEFLDLYSSLIFWYMYGMDNTPILEWDEPKRFNAEVEKAYEVMMATETGSAQIIKEHVAMMQDASFELSWEDQWKLTHDEMMSYFGIAESE